MIMNKINVLVAVCLLSVVAVFTFKKDDKTIASCILLIDEDTAHYHLSGSDPEYIKLYPNNLMIWEIIKFAF